MEKPWQLVITGDVPMKKAQDRNENSVMEAYLMESFVCP
jgi:hypothetical protein